MVIQEIGIIGSGTMGGGIAQLAAQNGFSVVLEDINEEYVAAGLKKIQERLEKRVNEGKLNTEEKEKLLSRISISTNLEEFKDSDLIIEAVTENDEIKKHVFNKLDKICRKDVIFTSNTSSISITRLAQATGRQDRFAGMHFMNPAYIMKLVEVVRGLRTSQETIDKIVSIAGKMGRVPVIVNDSPGFISNRLLMPMINEAVYCLYDGIASIESIDTVMKLGANHPMGPLELADLIGLDVCLAVLEILHKDLGEKYMPCPLLRKMVAGGKLGKKNGEGFYDYRK
jgi:3-hydroxybutyryl-CoA dehydrogenase